MVSSMARAGLAAALFAPLLACTPQTEPAAPRGDVVIGGHSYRLPDEAFADGLVDHGPQDQLLLELPVPVKDGVEPATVQLLLTAPRTSDERERERLVVEDVRLEAHIHAADLAHTSIPFKIAAGRAPDAPPQLVQVLTYPSKSIQLYDVYVRPPLAGFHEFVACNRLGPAVNFPHCSHEFAAPGIEVKASYDREYLAHWDGIRTYVLSYLQSHRVK